MDTMRLLLPAALLLAVAPPLVAQAPRLTLAEALRRADASAYANRAASAEARAAVGTALEPLQGILPGVRAEASVVRTTDPLQAFGMLLRQREVTPAAFDPASLNSPAARTNVGAGLVAEVPLFNADAWLGRKATQRAADAAGASADWTRWGTRVDVIRAWTGAVLAAMAAEALDTALTAARGHVRDAESAVRNGVATRSDALLADVRAGEVEVQWIEARARAAVARAGLAVALGTPEDTLFTLPSALPTADAMQSLVPELDGQTAPRSDVVAAQLGAEAAGLDRQRIAASLLPRLNGFGRLDWNSPAALFAGRSAWTVGVQLSWAPFTGARELGQLRAATERRAAADAMRDGAEAAARLEQQQRTSELRVAMARIAISGRAVRQAAEAHRIVTRKYRGGLATIVEALDAAAVETQARLQDAAARRDLIIAIADWRRVHGLDPAALAAMDALTTGTDE
jgi:outer membrane protein TolC